MHNRRNRSIISLLLIVAMLFTLGGGALAVKAPSDVDTWDGTVASSYAGGTGTADDPFIINKADQLALLAAVVNEQADDPTDRDKYPGGQRAYEGVYFRLEADLDLNGLDWTAIGGGQYAGSFGGVFDGYGHVVENLYIDETDGAAGSGNRPGNNIGLFGKLEDTGVIRNLGIGSGYVAGHRSVGGLLGKNWGTVENCYNAATVLGTQSQGVGGVVGASWVDTTVLPQIVNCYNVGAVTSEYASGSAGGIVGESEGYVQNCYATGPVTSPYNAGALVGSHNAATAVTVDDYYVLSTGGNATAGVGYVRTGTVDESAEAASAAAIPVEGLNVAYRGGSDGPVLFWETDEALLGNYSITVVQADGGTVSVATPANYSADYAFTYGSKVTLAYTVTDGQFEYFTFDGAALDGDTFFVTGSGAVSADFGGGEPEPVELQFAYSDVYTISVRVNGNSASPGTTVVAGDVIQISVTVHTGTSAGDGLEYNGNYTLDVTNASAQADGTYVVSGAGNVVITVTPEIAPLSWSTRTNTVWYDENETIFELYTAAQLAGLAKLVNEDGITFEGCTIYLNSNIDLSGRLWTPIGRGFNYSFRGVFDGDGFTVSGITTDGDSSDQGLFGFIRYVSSSGSPVTTVRNLTVEGNIQGTDYVGGVSAWVTGGAVVENCTNNATLVGGNYVGAICGVLEESYGSYLENCVNGTGSVNGVSGSGAPLYGGIQ